MKVLKVEILNFKNIESIQKELDGNSVWIVAKNGKGKTSFIQAIWSALTGKEFPDKPVKEGEERGEIRLEIGDTEPKYVVELSFSQKNSKGTLTVSTPEGGAFGSPRTFLNKIVGDITFDPLEMIKLKPDQLLTKVKQMLGLDFDDIDMQIKQAYDERTMVNREVDNYKGIVAKSGLTPIDFKTYEKEKDDTNIRASLQNIEVNRATIESTKALCKTLTENIKVNKQSIIDLQKSIDVKEKQLVQEKKKLEKMKDVVSDEEVEKLTQEIENIKQHNDKHKKVLEVKSAKNTLEEKIEKSQALSDKIDSLKEEKKNILNNSKMPVEGLTFGDDELLLNGLPFNPNQINKAKVIEIGCKLATTLNKELEIMRIDGNSLDDDTLKGVIEYMNKNNYQLFIEKIDSNIENLSIQFIEK